ncbi:MAG: NADH dehydrogenase (quinone) subunit G [Desulfuromonas sp.]|nr:MAG: NADH dehydrogenase (quinone) subunit G [Desulfuromonas sp.]
MPTLTIDNKSITVPDGTNVLEAAQRLGIVIPHFCYHEALGAVGACRLCAMMFEEGPVKGLQMACMVTAQDGMQISTLHPEAQELRSHVIEWMMLNHPHDCPVCDEGGECQLQDMTIAGGHGRRRYAGKKRTWINQDLGPFVVQEMNRCIQCYRCVRTYQDYCGGDDFGVMGSRNRLFFGRFQPGKLESPFSGNLVDVCPTGVFTDKTFRFKTRYWDIEEAPAVCPHCSLGCTVIPGARYRELQRVRAGVNRQTNGFFICDRSRFGYGYANHRERIRQPNCQGAATSWREALEHLKERLGKVVNEYGPLSVAIVGSPRSSLECQALLREWTREHGYRPPLFEIDNRRDRTARILAAGLGKQARSMAEIADSDCLVMLGSDPLNEAPLLALAIRQAVRNGCHVTCLDPRAVKLPCAASHLPVQPEQLLPAINGLVANRFEEFERQDQLFLEGAAERLGRAERPVLVGGGDLLGPEGTEALLKAARSLNAGLFVTLGGPNSYGGALLSEDGPDSEEMIEAALEGEIKALFCIEADPLTEGPARSARALGQLELLVVCDHMVNRTARSADIFLPTTAPPEAAGTYINNEGRMLPFGGAYAPGLPLRDIGEGGHPPRTFSNITTGGEPRPAWAILATLLQRPLDFDSIHHGLESDPHFAGLGLLSPGGEGRRVTDAGMLPPAAQPEFPHSAPEGSLPLLVVEALFGTEPLSSLSPALEPVIPEAAVQLHPTTAARLGISDGETVSLRTELEHLRLTARTEAEMVPGLLVAYRLRGTPLELLPVGKITPCLLEKGGNDA